jgi:hypothetical protein
MLVVRPPHRQLRAGDGFRSPSLEPAEHLGLNRRHQRWWKALEARRLNRRRQTWDEGGTALGVIATIPCVQVVHALAQTRLGFIVIDMEHGAIDAAAAHGTGPFCKRASDQSPEGRTFDCIVGLRSSHRQEIVPSSTPRNDSLRSRSATAFGIVPGSLPCR